MTPITRFTQVLDFFGQRIVDGHWSVGACIDPDDIAIEISVSRTLLREAVRVLEDKRLIKATPGVGTRVRPVQTWNILDADVARWIGQSPDHAELKVASKELAFVLASCAPDLQNPYLIRALGVLGRSTVDGEAS